MDSNSQLHPQNEAATLLQLATGPTLSLASLLPSPVPLVNMEKQERTV